MLDGMIWSLEQWLKHVEARVESGEMTYKEILHELDALLAFGIHMDPTAFPEELVFRVMQLMGRLFMEGDMCRDDFWNFIEGD
jgi:hypothetical protein